jgi:hypothetical protein
MEADDDTVKRSSTPNTERKVDNCEDLFSRSATSDSQHLESRQTRIDSKAGTTVLLNSKFIQKYFSVKLMAPHIHNSPKMFTKLFSIVFKM